MNIEDLKIEPNIYGSEDIIVNGMRVGYIRLAPDGTFRYTDRTVRYNPDKKDKFTEIVLDVSFRGIYHFISDFYKDRDPLVFEDLKGKDHVFNSRSELGNWLAESGRYRLYKDFATSTAHLMVRKAVA